MKTKYLALLVLISLATPSMLNAQSTAFTYQGRLNHSGSPANGLFEMSFALYDAVTNGNAVVLPVTLASVPVSNGLFIASLDFGATAFTGAGRWLGISVRTNGSSDPYTPLIPRQSLTPTPYALHAYNAAGLMSFANAPLDVKVNGQRALRLEPTAANSANVIGGSHYNYVTAGVHGATIAGGGGDYLGFLRYTNRVSGDFGTIGGGINNEIIAGGLFGTIGGGSDNYAGNSAFVGGGSGNRAIASGATIAGGGYARSNAGYAGNIVSGELGTVGGGYFNSVEAFGGFVGGGGENAIQTNAFVATIGGGYSQTIGGGAEYATIAGGFNNAVRAGAHESTIGGGNRNVAGAPNATVSGGGANTNSGLYATIGGGQNNTIKSNASFSTIGGGAQNTIRTNVLTSTISGGYFNTIESNSFSSTIGGGEGNEIGARSGISTIGGGAGNVIQSNAFSATIGGGFLNLIDVQAGNGTISGGANNTIHASSSYCTIAGGDSNSIETEADDSTIGGGTDNKIGAYASYSTISGGSDHTIGSNAEFGAIGGGRLNTIQPDGQFATVPGGWFNNAAGYAFAAGSRAKANHTGTFVWGDFTNSDIASTNNNSMTFRASGGVRIFSDSGASTGVHLSPGSGTWSSLSDRNAKENFTAANARDILAKVAALPLASWNYKAQDKSVRHLGPMAQDFHTAFGLGESERTITTVDADGVALAAIQGLHAEVKEKDAEIQELKKGMAELKELVGKLAAERKVGAR